MSERKQIFADKLLELAYESTPNYSFVERERRNKGQISSLISTTPNISHYQSDIQNRKKIKQAFAIANNSATDAPGGRLWFDSIPKIFWLGWAKKLKNEEVPKIVSSFLERRGKGEINLAEFSCVGFSNGLDNLNSQQLAVGSMIGFQIDGDVTYAVKGDAWSNERSRAHPYVKEWYQKRGLELPIRPSADPVHSLVGNVVLAPEDIKSSNGVIGEIIIKNWEIQGIIVQREEYYPILEIMPTWKDTKIWLESLPKLYPEYEIIYI